MTNSPQPESKTSLRWTLAVAVVLAAVLVLVFREDIALWWGRTIGTLTTAEEFRAWVEGFGAWGPLVFLIAQAFQVILVPIPGAIFPPVGSLAFGPWLALLLSLAGMALGSAVVFLAARRWGRPLALRLAGEDNVKRYEGLIEARGNILLWLVFLLPLLPDDAICAMAGISKIGFRRFMVIATVGRIPAVAAGVFTMAGLEGAPVWVWVTATVVGLALVWAGFRYKDRFERRILGEAAGDTETGVEEPAPPAPTDLQDRENKSSESFALWWGPMYKYSCLAGGLLGVNRPDTFLCPLRHVPQAT